MRLTFDSQPNTSPVWSPDGRWIYYSSSRFGIVEIYKKLADGSGTAEPVVRSADFSQVWDFSRDGRFLLYDDHSPQTNDDIWMLPLNPPGKATPILNSPDSEIGARLSPDGRWVTYLLSEENTLSGQIFVAAFPPTGARWQVSTGTGYWPEWRSDGRELFYCSTGVSPDLMSVEIIPGATFQAKTAKLLFKIDPAEHYVHPSRSGFVVFPGGQKFLVNQIVSAGGGPPLTVLSNWRAVLNQ
jgi:Tol biopolymer transport system component